MNQNFKKSRKKHIQQKKTLFPSTPITTTLSLPILAKKSITMGSPRIVYSMKVIFPMKVLQYALIIIQNIHPIERTYNPCCKYKVDSLYSFCIELQYKCLKFH